MKTRTLLALAALTTITLGSCSKNDDQSTNSNFPADGVIRVATSVGEMKTRAGMTADRIAHFDLKIENPADAVYSYFTWMKGSNKDGWKSHKTDGSGAYLPMRWKNKTDKVKVTAYYQSNKSYSDAEFTGGTIITSVSAGQHLEPEVVSSDALYMAPTEKDPSKDLTAEGKLPIAFTHLHSKLNLTIKLGTELNTAINPIMSVEVKGTYLKATFNPMTGVITPQTTDGVSPINAFASAYTPGETTKNAVATYEVIIIPQTVAAEALTVNIMLNHKVYEWKSSAEAIFATGTQYALELTVGKDFTKAGNLTSKEWTDGIGSNITAQ